MTTLHLQDQDWCKQHSELSSLKDAFTMSQWLSLFHPECRTKGRLEGSDNQQGSACLPAVTAPRETELGGPLKSRHLRPAGQPNTNKTKLSRKQVIHHRKTKRESQGDVKDLGMQLRPQNKKTSTHATIAAQKILAKTAKSKLKNL